MKPLLFALTLLLAAPAWAQPDNRPAGPIYDATTVETLRGVVLSVELHPSRHGAGNGVHLAFEVDGGTVPIHLGPAWFINNQDDQIAAGDVLVVVGSRVTLDGDTFVIAREVLRDDAILTLRDDAGLPVWRGWRRGANGPRGPRNGRR